MHGETIQQDQGQNLKQPKQYKAHVRHGYPWVPTDQAHGHPRQVGPAY
jgi:hypothetical protein